MENVLLSVHRALSFRGGIGVVTSNQGRWTLQQRRGTESHHGSALEQSLQGTLHTRRGLARELKLLRAEAGARSGHCGVVSQAVGCKSDTTKAASRRENPSLTAAFPGSRRAGMDLPERTWGGLTPAPISLPILPPRVARLNPRCPAATYL